VVSSERRRTWHVDGGGAHRLGATLKLVGAIAHKSSVFGDSGSERANELECVGFIDNSVPGVGVTGTSGSLDIRLGSAFIRIYSSSNQI
jgi:hypothetical protein